MPETGSTVNHDSLDDADHEVFDHTDAEPDPS